MKIENKPTQVERLKAELKTGKKLTGMDIISMNILNYKGCIHKLRQSGLSISTEMVKTRGGARIALYKLVENS